MKSIKTQGNEIIDIKVMHQSKRARVTIELTENDTKVLAGALMAWRANGLLFDSEFKPSEKQGEDNGSELPKQHPTIYEDFKRVCEEYSGLDYYRRLKAHLGIQHLSDLEKKHSKSMVEDILKCQKEYIRFKQILSNSPIPNISEYVVENISSLTHKDNAYNLWKKLFEGFNT